MHRHIAISLDERDDTLSIYLDGYLGWKGNWGSKVKDADCGAGREIAFGRWHPGWKDASPVGVGHLHWYARQVQLEAEAWKLAHAAVAGLDEAVKCVYDQAVVDKQWKDEQGDDCAWFASHRYMSHQSICKLAGPREMCPVACLAYQRCFVPKAQTNTFSYGTPRRQSRKNTEGHHLHEYRGWRLCGTVTTAAAAVPRLILGWARNASTSPARLAGQLQRI